ncbi:MAG: hypothetical protein SFX18_14495 [Pirellulales bacterium]|nr:hypothetical protein [Pirellulales bacterium]
MRITWLVSAEITGNTPETWDCQLASVRYRVLAPARQLHQRGEHVGWLRFEQLAELAAAEKGSDAADHDHWPADVVILSKVFAQNAVPALRYARAQGSRVLVDLCDDHFDHPALGPVYHELCAQADGVIASTRAMAELIRQRTGRSAIQIDDPLEGPGGVPRFNPDLPQRPLRLAWFGHPVNFDTVAPCLPELQKLSVMFPLELRLITDLAAVRDNPFGRILEKATGPRLQIQALPWSQALTWQALAECDIVLLPSLPDQKKLVKSPNRAVEGIHAGRLVLAYPLPAYTELAGGLWLGEDLCQGIRWAVNHPVAARQLISQGQVLIRRRFLPEIAGQAWGGVVEAVLEQEACVP